MDRSEIMRRVKGRDTGPERVVAAILRRLRQRPAVAADLPGRPDFVLRRARLAVFVHGCFWHGHDCARGARVPTTNRPYWAAKIARNRTRDRRVRRALNALGWRTAVVWECRLRDPALVARRLARLVAEPKRARHR